MSTIRDGSSNSSSRPSRPRRRSSSKSTTGSSSIMLQLSSPPPSSSSSNNNTDNNHNNKAMMMMIEEPESCLPRVFNLQKYQVVLGRYNRCTKTKALTPAVKLYKRVRDQCERGENLSQLPQIKQRIGKLLQEELGYPEPPPVTFWVDVHKAEKDGKLNDFMEKNPQLRRCKDHDGDEVVFVQDHDDYFLKADLAGHKKRRSKSNGEKGEGATTTSNKKTKQSKSLKAIMEDHKNRKSSYAARDAATRRSSVTSVTSRTVSTMGSGSINSGSAISSSRPGSAMGSSVVSSSTSSSAAPLFQLTPGSGWLDDEVDRISCEWILQDGPTSSLDIITRKTNLVQTFKSYVAYFRRLLQRNDPCKGSPDIALQRMNEGLLVQVVNVLGNSMVDWYNKYPSSCLAGETNAWNEELGDIEEQQQPLGGVSTSVSRGGLVGGPGGGGGAASDIDSKASIGTYEVSSQDDKDLEDASRRFSEFDISGGSDWIIPGDIEEDVTQEDEFDEDDDDDEEGEEFTQTASSEIDDEEMASPPNYKEQHLLREWSPYNSSSGSNDNNAAESESSPAKLNGVEAAVTADFLLDAETTNNSNHKRSSKKGSSCSRSSSSSSSRGGGVRGWTKKRPSLSKYSRVKSPIVDDEDEEK